MMNPISTRQSAITDISYVRMLSVYGYDDAPHGHGHVSFNNVRVPADAMVLGEGRGFEIIQGRLGPGRIHHAMRSIGAAERALEYMIARINDENKKTFGQPLSSHGVLIEWIAKSRIEIDAARLIVLNAAIKIDAKDAKFALKEIARGQGVGAQHGAGGHRPRGAGTRRHGRVPGHAAGQHVGADPHAAHRRRAR